MTEIKTEIKNEVDGCKDIVVLNNILLLLRRSKVGMDKYGVGLDRNDLTHDQRMNHLLEELLDACNYITASRH